MEPYPFQGVYSAVLTPLRDDLSCDHALLASHCNWLLREGCHGVSLFGSTGEGASFSVEERMAALEAVLAAGVPAQHLLPATGCAAFPDTLRLTCHAVAQGVT